MHTNKSSCNNVEYLYSSSCWRLPTQKKPPENPFAHLDSNLLASHKRKEESFSSVAVAVNERRVEMTKSQKDQHQRRLLAHQGKCRNYARMVASPGCLFPTGL